MFVVFEPEPYNSNMPLLVEHEAESALILFSWAFLYWKYTWGLAYFRVCLFGDENAQKKKFRLFCLCPS